ncbi:MAG: GNAT family N-acetyltransferase [Chloroflexota bacterium]
MFTIEGYTIRTFAEQDDYAEHRRILEAAWSPFMMEDSVANAYFDALYDELPAFQFLMYEPTGVVVATANSVPLHWDGTVESLSPQGWDHVLVQGLGDHRAGRRLNTVSALAIAVDPARLGSGLSTVMVRAMRRLAAEHGAGHLIAPVRPNFKARYPLTPIERYITWCHTDGESPFDPWMRVHWRLGATIAKACPESMRIPGTVAQWEAWAGMRFPETDMYIVPGALAPVTIDREADSGLYVEPNVWMIHPLESTSNA